MQSLVCDSRSLNAKGQIVYLGLEKMLHIQQVEIFSSVLYNIPG